MRLAMARASSHICAVSVSVHASHKSCADRCMMRASRAAGAGLAHQWPPFFRMAANGAVRWGWRGFVISRPAVLVCI